MEKIINETEFFYIEFHHGEGIRKRTFCACRPRQAVVLPHYFLLLYTGTAHEFFISEMTNVLWKLPTLFIVPSLLKTKS